VSSDVGATAGDSVLAVGDVVGFQVEEFVVGPIVGTFVEFVGEVLGLKVRIVGDFVARGVGFFVVGDLVGLVVEFVGDDVGANVSPFRVGALDGA
jgi:hypothetical protein